MIEASPATKAGMRVGDVLTSINGKPASGMTLETVRGMFRRPGRSYRLTVKRNAMIRRIKLVTDRII